MGAGVPTVSTPTEGIAEVISDGQTGMLVPSGDVTALAHAVRRLLTDGALAATIADRGRETVAAQHTAGVMAKSIEAVYEELL